MCGLRTRTVRVLGLLMALALTSAMVLAACDDDDDETINIAYIPGWPDAVSTSNLWKVLLEEQGYTVELTGLEVAATYAGLARGDADMYLSTWLPNTHEVYADEFAEVEQLTVWYQPAGLFLTVPAHVDEVNSLADLADNADLFDSTIQGIEAGAGMMGILRDRVMPAYGIEDWELIEASTPAMLTALDGAVRDGEPIVVTLWSPGWWYGEYDLKNLEDPENAWGEPDQLTVVTRPGFADDFPEVAAWLSNWSMTDDQYSPLEALVDEMEGNEEEAVRQWLEDPENRALADSWIN
jgi:glycine betaine/proline transport system substrate-binding protein